MKSRLKLNYAQASMTLRCGESIINYVKVLLFRN